MKKHILILMMITLVCVMVVGMYPAFGSDTSNKSVESVTTVNTYADWNTPSQIVKTLDKTDVCIYKPFDSYIDTVLPSIILEQVQTHNVTANVVSIVDQKANQGADCKFIIKIDRAINQNDRFVERTTKYIISGNVATIFSYKIGAPFNPAHVPNTPMTNWNCEMTAHASKYYSNYHITDEGYYHTYTGYCDPYARGSNPEKIGELPINVIRYSVDVTLKTLGL